MLKDKDLVRYEKQIIIDDIGHDGQEKIKKSKVLVVGAGGLGSPVIMYLAALGIGEIGIMDHDKVSLSNLNRQILYKEKDAGKSKVALAKGWINKFSKEIKVNIYDKELSEMNIEEIMNGYDIIIAAVDNMDTRFLINNIAVTLAKPWVDGGVSDLFGYAGIYLPGKGCLECHKKNIPSKKAVGAIGAVCGVIASLEVQIALNYILNKNTDNSKMIVYDAKSLTFNEVKIKKDNECILCK